MKNAKISFTSVDQYIGSFPQETKKILEEVRAVIRAAAPEAREKISYQMASFELNGRNLVYLAGWKTHIAIYPIPSGSDAFNKEVAQYIDGKGTLRFPLDKPMPLKLIGRIVKYRRAESLKK